MKPPRSVSTQIGVSIWAGLLSFLAIGTVGGLIYGPYFFFGFIVPDPGSTFWPVIFGSGLAWTVIMTLVLRANLKRTLLVVLCQLAAIGLGLWIVHGVEYFVYSTRGNLPYYLIILIASYPIGWFTSGYLASKFKGRKS